MKVTQLRACSAATASSKEANSGPKVSACEELVAHIGTLAQSKGASPVFARVMLTAATPALNKPS